MAGYEIWYLAEIPKQSVEGAVWFLLITCTAKYKKRGNELMMELLSKMEPELKDLENSQPVHITKNVKHVLSHFHIIKKKKQKREAGLMDFLDFTGVGPYNYLVGT